LRRICCLLLCVATASSCRIERTPDHFVDNQATPADELRAAEAELRGRILAVGTAIQRRNASDLASALGPHEDLSIIGPADGQVITTPAEVLTLLTELAGTDPLMARAVDVDVSPRMNVAWFQSDFGSGGAGEASSAFRFSGVFIREEGEWRLVQGHISEPIEATPVP
jgi:hypothetical protein